MLIFDLTFTDGKACRYLCPDPEASEQTERASLEAIFCGRLASMVRIITPPPERLPWRRVANDRWELNRFMLTRISAGYFYLLWPDGSTEGDREHVSAAVRQNWEKGC